MPDKNPRWAADVWRVRDRKDADYKENLAQMRIYSGKHANGAIAICIAILKACPALAERPVPKINTDFWMKPIPLRQFDWAATYDDYEGGDGYDEPAGPIGYGATEEEAKRNLMNEYPRSGNPCSACGEPFFDGDTCSKGGCPCGGDF